MLEFVWDTHRNCIKLCPFLWCLAMYATNWAWRLLTWRPRCAILWFREWGLHGFLDELAKIVFDPSRYFGRQVNGANSNLPSDWLRAWTISRGQPVMRWQRCNYGTPGSDNLITHCWSHSKVSSRLAFPLTVICLARESLIKS